MAQGNRLRGVIEIHDFDGSVANTVEPTINRYLPEFVRKHEKLRKVAANTLFVFGELTGTGKKEVMGIARTGKASLNPYMIEMLRAHREEGAEIIMLTSNGHANEIRGIMSENSVEVTAFHCNPSKKADFVRAVVAGNPDKRVVSVNDSMLETAQAVVKGLRRKSVLFSGAHNSVSSYLMGSLRIASVADAKSMDKAVRAAAGT
ncbi:MAG: hypothetical protein KGH57_03780 [Candidatus Micrarchaeota archaeon]|nr:hypothetical protein [Candidatus Micrarchaeota archaeon]